MQGDTSGGVGSIAGAAIGTYFGGPIGGAIGSFVGGEIFGGGGGRQKPSQVGLMGGPGNYYISQIDVPGGEANVPFYQSVMARLNDPRQFDQAMLAQFAGRYIGGGAGESAESMVQKLLAALEPAHQVAQQQLATQQALLQAQQELNRTMQGLADSLDERLGIPLLERYRESLAVSEYLAPERRFGAARDIFERTYAGAMGGDLVDVQAVPQALDTLIRLGRDMYASGPQFAQIWEQSVRQLDELTAKQKDVEADIRKELPATIIQTGHDNVFAIRQQTAELKAQSERVERELRRIGDLLAA
jgi:hypothetical protein